MSLMGSFYNVIESVIKPLAFSKAISTVHIDEKIFRLHYRATTIILVVFSSVLLIRDYLRENIKCLRIQEDDTKFEILDQDFMESYCFFTSSTFTVPWTIDTGISRNHAYATGGGRLIISKNDTNARNDTMFFKQYYQWVPYFLFFMAILFYAPHAIWKAYEKKKLASIVVDLNVRKLTEDSKEDERLSQIASYLLKTKGQFISGYSYKYVFCEFLNLFIVLGNIYLTDLFLGREFSLYGSKVIDFLQKDPEHRMDPMALVFPPIAKCLFHKYGPSGSIERFDTICVLPSNIWNEKIFFFLWCWYIILALITASFIIYRIACLMSPQMRRNNLGVDSYEAQSKLTPVLNRLGVSGWIVLRLLRINLDSFTFNKLIEKTFDHI